MNDDWGPWNARWNGAGETDGYGDPTYPDGAERYRDAYRHLVTLFRAEGATNVTFVFHVDSLPAAAAGTRSLLLPGRRVRRLARDLRVRRSTARRRCRRSRRKLDVSGVYTTMTKLSRRPIAIAEMGASSAAGEKAAWIRGAFAALRSGTVPADPCGDLVEHGQREHADRLVARRSRLRGRPELLLGALGFRRLPAAAPGAFVSSGRRLRVRGARRGRVGTRSGATAADRDDEGRRVDELPRRVAAHVPVRAVDPGGIAQPLAPAPAAQVSSRLSP